MSLSGQTTEARSPSAISFNLSGLRDDQEAGGKRGATVCVILPEGEDMLSTAALLLVSGMAWGQTFEVASIKEHVGPMHFMGVRTQGARLEGVTTVRGLVMWAYGVRSFQVAGDMDNTFYEVEANTAGGRIPAREEFRAMLRNVLADRFKLKVHSETRELPVYLLVIGKAGPKLKTGDKESKEPVMVQGMGRNYEISMANAKISDFLQMLDNSGFLDRPTVDRTGLEGSYKIELRYTPAFEKDDPENTDIFVAVQSQLGLKLQQGKARVDVTVVDHVERPSAN
jgi:uncharacterized protein (TIGR03435 family)